jgi:3,4-dihydroxy 2-butanone 4-phosphate synthase
MRLSGLRDAAVLCELTNVDVTMSWLPEICTFASKQDMTVVTIEDIYQYRLMTEKKLEELEMVN